MKTLSLFAALLIVVAGCTQNTETEMMSTEKGMEHSTLVATMMPVNNSGVYGSVTFSKTDDGVSIEGSFEGLTPGSHGFHIHEYGDCTADDGTSAGGHFNPSNNEHGAPTDELRHMGDLGNIEANEEGMASVSVNDPMVSLEQILGRGVIIHAGEDDLQSQPTGAAGSRVACGVIGVAQQ